MKKSLVSNSLFNILYKVVNALYPLIAVTYTSHILQASKMGVISYAQNIVSYFAIFAALGLPTYGVREMARTADSKEQRSKLFWELFDVNFMSTSFVLIVYILLIFSVGKFRDNSILYVISGSQIVLNYINVDWFYQGMEKYKYIALRSVAVKILLLILLPFLIKTSDDYLNYALLYCLGIAGNNIFNIIKIRNYINFKKYHLEFRKHLKPILILLMASLAIEVYAMIDTTMLGIFCDDATVGCYSNAMKLIRTVNTIAAAIGGVLLPRLSLIYNEGNLKKYNEIVNRGIKIVLMIAIPALAGIIILSENCVMLLFGSSFVDAIPILRILALMIPVVAVNTILGAQVLVTANMENKYVLSVSICACINVILNATFIPQFGAESAAVASLLSEIIVMLLYIYHTRSVIKINLPLRYIISTLLPISIYCMLAIIVLKNLPFGNLMMIIINIAACIVIYFGLGVLLNNESIMFSFEKLKIYLQK